MGIVKIKILSSLEDNKTLIELFGRLFNIPPELLATPHLSKELYVSFLTFNLDGINLKEVDKE